MSRKARIPLFLFTSILLLFTIFWFTPVSLLPSSISEEVFTFSKHQEHNHDAYYVNDSENQENDSWPENPVVDDKDVVVLTDKNFSDFITTNQYVMVEFYASWCFWSRKLAPEYSAAATLLKGEAVLAKVEAGEERELGRKYRIQGYPTMKLFVGGIPKASYYGERTRDAIATWMRQKTGLVVQIVSTTEEAERIPSTNSVIVMGFLDTLEGPDTKELAAASKLHVDINFYQTDNADVVRFLGIDPQIKRPTLIMLRRELTKHSHIGFDDKFTRSAISDFVSVNKHPLVITFTEKYASNIFENPTKQVWLFAPKYSLKLISAFEKAAKTFREKDFICANSVEGVVHDIMLLFVYVKIDDSDFGLGANLGYQFGPPDGSPRVVAYISKGHAKYIYRGEFTFGGIKSFAEEFLEDKLSFQSVPTSKTLLRLPSDSDNSNPSLISNA